MPKKQRQEKAKQKKELQNSDLITTEVSLENIENACKEMSVFLEKRSVGWKDLFLWTIWQGLITEHNTSLWEHPNFRHMNLPSNSRFYRKISSEEQTVTFQLINKFLEILETHMNFAEAACKQAYELQQSNHIDIYITLIEYAQQRLAEYDLTSDFQAIIEFTKKRSKQLINKPIVNDKAVKQRIDLINEIIDQITPIIEKLKRDPRSTVRKEAFKILFLFDWLNVMAGCQLLDKEGGLTQTVVEKPGRKTKKKDKYRKKNKLSSSSAIILKKISPPPQSIIIKPDTSMLLQDLFGKAYQQITTVESHEGIKKIIGEFSHYATHPQYHASQRLDAYSKIMDVHALSAGHLYKNSRYLLAQLKWEDFYNAYQDFKKYFHTIDETTLTSAQQKNCQDIMQWANQNYKLNIRMLDLCLTDLKENHKKMQAQLDASEERRDYIKNKIWGIHEWIHNPNPQSPEH